MTRRKSENKIIEIKPEFESILVCNKKQLRPFVEVIIEKSENISHQNLGTLIGILEITDVSEDSSYVVNYLISVIKKEYFSKSKRGPIESLEAALHKANLALASLAEHENIGWLGKLNALIAVTEKNNLHLSQTGSASAFLLRAKILTDISEGLSSSEAEPYPLKTFVNVSSGRLEENDKLIITTANIFDIFSLEELKKSALRFSDQEFVQFLRTALGNELDQAATLIADLKPEKKELPEKHPAAPQKNLNVFSQDAFANNSSKNKKHTLEEKIQEEIQETPREFTDKKTGHIYIKEDYEAPQYPKESYDYGKIFFEKASGFLGGLPKRISGPAGKMKMLSAPKINIDGEKIKEHSRRMVSCVGENAKKCTSHIKPIVKKSVQRTARLAARAFSPENRAHAKDLGKKTSGHLFSLSKMVIPNIRKLKEIFARMEYQQKIYAILALLLIMVGPIFILKMQNEDEPQTVTTQEIVQVSAPLPIDGEINVSKIDPPQTIFSGESILKTVNLGGEIFAVTKKSVIKIQGGQEFPLPENFSSPTNIIDMEDLRLIFIFNSKNEITAFSPVSGKFSPNSISVPQDSKIVAVGTYLTYIYLADGKNGQIYRYPRAEGGFGEKSDWLKDQIDLSRLASLAMNDNIFVSDNSKITKLFRGKIQDLSMQKTNTPMMIDKIALGDQTGNLFILDKQNSRVIHFDAEGRIKSQYYHPEISSASGIEIDEKTSQIYLTGEKSLRTIAIK